MHLQLYLHWLLPFLYMILYYVPYLLANLNKVPHLFSLLFLLLLLLPVLRPRPVTRRGWCWRIIIAKLPICCGKTPEHWVWINWKSSIPMALRICRGRLKSLMWSFWIRRLRGRVGKICLLLWKIAWKTEQDRKSTRLNSSHRSSSYAVFCLKKKNIRKC